MSLVVVEGMDGAGKSSQARELAKRLGGRWKLQAFPDRATPIGKLIDGYLRGTWRVAEHKHGEWMVEAEHDRINALVFQGLQFANRLEHMGELSDAVHGTTQMVLDRYWQSGVVYGSLDGLDREWLISASHNFPQARLNILLDVPAKLAAERMKVRGAPPEHYERLEVLEKLRQSYLDLWDAMRATHFRDAWPVVDGDDDPAEVSAEVASLVAQHRGVL